MKYSANFLCKRKCLFMLFQFGYSCACTKMVDNTDNFHIHSAESLIFVNVSHPTMLNFNLSRTLFNLTRTTIRRHILKMIEIRNCENLYTSILQLPLPIKLKQALLLQDCNISDTI